MQHGRLLTTIAASMAVALIAAAGLAGSATSAAADGVYFGFGVDDGPRMPPPPPRWGWGAPPPPPGPGWGAPGWGPPPRGWAPAPACRSRWVDQPVVDPWGRIIRYQRVQVMDCGPRHHRRRW